MLLTALLLGFLLSCEAQAFYNPSTGRWLNRDPIEEAGGLNLYVSCLNTPTSVVDLDDKPLRWDTIEVVDNANRSSWVNGWDCCCGEERSKVDWSPR